MTDREKLIALMVEAESLCAAIDCYEDAALCEYAGEVNGCAAFRADHLIANGVVVREKGEWVTPTIIGGRAYDIPHCSVCEGVPCGVDENTKFCAHCGADMIRRENDG